jgi:hypothetical protein
MRYQTTLLALLLVAAAGCDHSEPFTPDGQGGTTAREPGNAFQLTFNFQSETSASWLPDGSGFLFSYVNPESRLQQDRCLGLMSATGGQIQQTICDTSILDSARTDLFDAGAVSPDGLLFYSRDTERPDQVGPGAVPGLGDARLMLASLAHPFDTTAVATLPYLIDGRPQTWISQTGWITPTKVAYLSGVSGNVALCPGCTGIPFRSGKFAVTIDFTDNGPVLQKVAGTDNASGVAAGGGDAIYYSLAGDGRVFRRDLITSSTAVVADFGDSAIVRDISVAGNRLLAVVGGKVQLVDDANFGVVLYDQGGFLHLTDLSTGTDQVISLPIQAMVRRPAISPAGDRAVVEAYPFTVTPSNMLGIPPDTAFSTVADLWMVELP